MLIRGLQGQHTYSKGMRLHEKKACLCLFLYRYVSKLLGWIFVVFLLEPFFRSFSFFCMSTSQLPPGGDGSVRKGVGLTPALLPHVRIITECKGFMSLHFTCVSQHHFQNGLWFKHNAAILESTPPISLETCSPMSLGLAISVQRPVWCVLLLSALRCDCCFSHCTWNPIWRMTETSLCMQLRNWPSPLKLHMTLFPSSPA